MNPSILPADFHPQAHNLRNDEVKKRFLLSQQLFRHAMTFQPHEIVTFSNDFTDAHPQVEPTASTFELIGDIVLASYPKSESDDIESVINLLKYALHDTHRVLCHLDHQYPDISDTQFVDIFSHPESANSMALLSLRSNRDMNEYIDNTLPRTARIHDGAFVIEDSSLEPKQNRVRNPSKKCPAAGGLLPDVVPKPLPAFSDAIPWLAEVVVLSREWQTWRQRER